ncbi:FadR/GntR family transcriptional regulator [Rhizobiaceae sp. 2RAB30]
MKTPKKPEGNRTRHVLGGKVLELVLSTLGAAILGGQYRPGQVLPREDELMSTLRVSRTTLREAIKVLCAKGLLETRQRVGATVRPHRDWNLLDPAVLSWHPDIRTERELISGLLEMRRIIEPAAAELAAARATAADLARIEAAFLRMEQASANDPRESTDADLAFHSGIIMASGNVVLQRIGSTIEAALSAAFMITNTSTETPAEALAAHRHIMERIRFRDGAGARAAMNEMLDIAAKDLGETGMFVPLDAGVQDAGTATDSGAPKAGKAGKETR